LKRLEDEWEKGAGNKGVKLTQRVGGGGGWGEGQGGANGEEAWRLYSTTVRRWERV